MSRTAAAALLIHLTLAPQASAGSVHDEAHGDVGFGLGLLTVGAGLGGGYRTDFGARFEAAVGTIGLASGGSLGAGFSFRAYDGPYFTLEVPLMVYAVGASVDPLDFGSDCSRLRLRHGDVPAGRGGWRRPGRRPDLRHLTHEPRPLPPGLARGPDRPPR
jgi:hypothetical protein